MNRLLFVIGLVLPTTCIGAEPDYSKPPEAKGKFAKMWNGRTWDDYWAMLWIKGESFQQKPVEPVLWKMREMGCNGGMVYRAGEDDLLKKFFMPYYDENMFRFSYCKRQAEYDALMEKYIKTRDKNVLQRVPCLDDMEWREKAKQELVKIAKRRVGSHAIAYSIEDESSLSFFARDLDFDFSPKSLAQFRLWLKDRYGSLDKMNAEWGTEFKQWDDVIPNTLLEVLPRKDRNYSSWADHRDYMEHSFAATLNDFEKAIRTVDPETPVGLVGAQMPGVSTGYNYWLLCNNTTFIEPYDIGNSIECVRSFQKIGEHKVFWVTTLFVKDASQIDMAKFRLWHYMLHGSAGTIIWESTKMVAGNPPELTPEAKGIAPTLKELENGVSRLLLTAERDDDPIAIHYSQASIRGRYLLRWIAEKPSYIPYTEKASAVRTQSPLVQSWEGLTKLIEDSGCQYKFVATEQIESGELLKKGYKVLILPLSVSLTEKEVDEMKKFAEAGGVVIADQLTGEMDGHCKMLPKGQLDDFFGIKRAATGVGKKIESRVMAKTAAAPVGFDVGTIDFTDFKLAENIQVSDSWAPALAGTVPGLITKRHGKGWSVYLNADFKDYAALRLQNNRGQAYRDILQKLLALGGVHRRAELLDGGGKPYSTGIETFYYKSGDTNYVALHHNHSLRQNELGDLQNLAWYGNTPELNVRLPKKAHVYDIRAGKYLGEVDSVKTKFNAAEPTIYALLPYKVDSVAADIKKDGKDLKFSANIQTSGAPGLHVFHTRVLDPDGREDEAYSDNFSAAGGKFASSFVVGSNDKKGLWTFEITDVATGMSAAKKIEFK